MANVTKKTTETIYILELTKREANALTELVLAANHFQGEGDVFSNVYDALVKAGAESDEVYHEIDDGEVIVTRGAA